MDDITEAPPIVQVLSTDEELERAFAQLEAIERIARLFAWSLSEDDQFGEPPQPSGA